MRYVRNARAFKIDAANAFYGKAHRIDIGSNLKAFRHRTYGSRKPRKQDKRHSKDEAEDHGLLHIFGDG